MKEKLIAVAVPVLIFAVACVLALALGLSANVILGNAEAGSSQSSLAVGPYLSTVALSSGVLIAILTFARDRERLTREREEGRAKILLEQAKEGLDEAYSLLQDQNNDRVIWVRAARVLLEAVALGSDITAPEYRSAYRLYEDKMRNKFFRALTVYNDQTKERDPLPPQFFYGLKHWDRSISLDDAAREASSEVVASSVTIDSVVAEPSLTPLAPKSVVAIFNFLEYPQDYSDPLPAVKLWDEEWEHSYGPNQGARRYLAHAQNTTAIGGKLHKLKNSS